MKERKVIWHSPMWGMTMYEPNKKAGKDPCRNCRLKGLCDDECGMKIGKLLY